MPNIRGNSKENSRMLFDCLIVNTGKVITPSIIALKFKKRSIPISHNTAVRFVGKMVEAGMFNKIDRIYVRDLTYWKKIAQLMGCSIPVARQVMHSKDFPLVECGRNLKVMKSEFIKWASQRRAG